MLQKTALKVDPWQSGPLAGRGNLVTMCANGDDSACDKIISQPGAVNALQTIDLQNPYGFSAMHPDKAASLARGILSFQIAVRGPRNICVCCRSSFGSKNTCGDFSIPTYCWSFAVAKPAAKAQGGSLLAEAERDLHGLSSKVEHFIGIDGSR
mmetsp:Transcript_59432/g.158124  ORF Transcript_59432/g.158124 Transcript_59432/m.158124 type:complete len:153 (-) Transcript_59432:109-567(-)